MYFFDCEQQDVKKTKKTHQIDNFLKFRARIDRWLLIEIRIFFWEIHPTIDLNVKISI